MQPNKTFFFTIIGLAIGAVAVMFAIRLYLPGPLNELAPLQQKVEIQVVVAPSLEKWASDAAQKFNQANPNAQVNIVRAIDLVPRSQFQAAPPPAAWLAEATFVVQLAINDGLRFEEPGSVASTSLAWGAYTDKLGQFNQDYGDLAWPNLHAKAIEPGDVLKIVIASPNNSAEGLAALLSAVAAQINNQNLSGSDIGAADAWLTETLGDGNAQPRATPAADLATQGRSLGDAGLLAMASWRSVKLDERSDFSVIPAEPQVVLDYPLAIWAGSQATPEAQAAARAFRTFLLEPAQQNALSQFYFDPAAGAPTGVQANGDAVRRLQDWANRTLR